MKYVYKHEVLSSRSLFLCMGWPREQLVLPRCVPYTTATKLVGNMMAVPVIGGVFFCGAARDASLG